MQTITITFFRPMTHDAGFLESTWHHVPEEEGVRLQFQEEFDAVEYQHENVFGGELTVTLVEQRRIVTGTFHPGRRILPHSAIEYELVYEIGTLAEIDEDEFFKRIQTCITRAMGRSDRYYLREYKRGNHTKKKEEPKENVA